MKTRVRVLLGIFLTFLSALSYAQAPVPFVNQPLVPEATALEALAASVGVAASKTFVLAVDEGTTANSVTVFSLNTTTGVTTQIARLRTGGTGLGGGAFYANTTVAVSANNSCIFVADTGSNDIAAFAAPTYKRVGNFSNALLNWSDSGAGGSISLSPDGKWLYGAYSGSENIGAWAVGSGCQLTFINSYGGGDLYLSLRVTPDGKALIVPSTYYMVVTMYSINGATGELTAVNSIDFTNSSTCITYYCYPYGVDISGDSKVAFFGSHSFGALALGCNINTTTGLYGAKHFLLSNVKAGVNHAAFPWFTAAAYPTGTGLMYIGMSGNPGNSGVVVAQVNENPSLGAVSSSLFATPDSSCNGCTGTLESVGTLAVSAQLPNLINVYSVNQKTGAFTLLKSNIDANATALLSLHVVPQTR